MLQTTCDRCGAECPPDPGPELLDARYALCAICLAAVCEHDRPPSVWTARRRGHRRTERTRRMNGRPVVPS